MQTVEKYGFIKILAYKISDVRPEILLILSSPPLGGDKIRF